MPSLSLCTPLRGSYLNSSIRRVAQPLDLSSIASACQTGSRTCYTRRTSRYLLNASKLHRTTWQQRETQRGRRRRRRKKKKKKKRWSINHAWPLSIVLSYVCVCVITGKEEKLGEWSNDDNGFVRAHNTSFSCTRGVCERGRNTAFVSCRDTDACIYIKYTRICVHVASRVASKRAICRDEVAGTCI